jgi:hypothetical protein
MEREITDRNGVTWTCVQAYSGLSNNAENQDAAQVKGQEDAYWVVCTPSGGANHTLTRCCSMKFKHSREYDHSKTKRSGQYRKARSGMLQLARIRHKHTPHNSLYIGDRP